MTQPGIEPRRTLYPLGQWVGSKETVMIDKYMNIAREQKNVGH